MNGNAVIDLFEFARNGERAEGNLPLASLQRIDLTDRVGSLHWRATCSQSREGKLFLEVEVQGEVGIICQRCLAPMRHALETHTRLMVVASEAELDAVPLDDDELDAIVGSAAYNLADLVEDEAILALPLVPKHEMCDGPVPGMIVQSDPDEAESNEPADSAGTDSERVSPFAVLANLRKPQTRQ